MNKYIFKQYNPIFPELYRKEEQRLKRILGDRYLIEHIGSTAVPNLGGKGVIDIMISVPKKLMNQTSQLLQKQAGYEFSASGGDEERLFHQQDLPDTEEGVRRYHTHVTFQGSESRKKTMAFRDYLVQHPKDLKRYAQIKQKAAIQAKGDRDTYLKVKQTIIDEIIQKALIQT